MQGTIVLGEEEPSLKLARCFTDLAIGIPEGLDPEEVYDSFLFYLCDKLALDSSKELWKRVQKDLITAVVKRDWFSTAEKRFRFDRRQADLKKD